ncbi:f1f0 atp synthase assembly protein atp10 [Moniliophthora roreri]|nr:f1f0 atp synthase assembly protein atp10 [Moniliophthora roreri]
MFSSRLLPLSCRHSSAWSRTWGFSSRAWYSTSNAKPKPTEPPSRPSRPAPSNVAADPSQGPLDISGLPYLSRPLGVRERPTTARKSQLQNIRESLTDEETIGRERKHLVKEGFTKGYFHDLNATRRHGGKTWIAPKVLIREDRALYLPEIAGKCLEDSSMKHTTTMCLGKITLLSLLSTKISELHSQSFTSLALGRYLPSSATQHPLLQHIKLNTQSNTLKAFLLTLLTRSLRAATPAHERPFYLLSSQNLEYLREPLGIDNDRVGYVYLIDEELRIRWAGCADATLEEAKALEVCTGVLLRRLEEREAKVRERATKKPGSD